MDAAMSSTVAAQMRGDGATAAANASAKAQRIRHVLRFG
jgi:hypothetical protein